MEVEPLGNAPHRALRILTAAAGRARGQLILVTTIGVHTHAFAARHDCPCLAFVYGGLGKQHFRRVSGGS